MGSEQDPKDLNMLGRSHMGQGHHMEAAVRFSELAQEAEEKLGPDDDETLDTRDYVAISFSQAGDFLKAATYDEESLRRRLGLKKSEDDVENQAILSNQYRVARSYSSLGKFREAISHLRAMLHTLEGTMSPATWDFIAEVRNELIIELFNAGKDKDIYEAVDISEKTLREAEPILGRAHRVLIDIRLNLGHGLMKIQKVEAASEHFLENKNVFGCMDPDSKQELKEALDETMDCLEICQASITQEEKQESSRKVLQNRLGVQRLKANREVDNFEKKSNAKQTKSRKRPKAEHRNNEHKALVGRLPGLQVANAGSSPDAKVSSHDTNAESARPWRPPNNQPFLTDDQAEIGNARRIPARSSSIPRDQRVRPHSYHGSGTVTPLSFLENTSSSSPKPPVVSPEVDGVRYDELNEQIIPKTGTQSHGRSKSEASAGLQPPKTMKLERLEDDIHLPGAWSHEFDTPVGVVAHTPKEALQHAHSDINVRSSGIDSNCLTPAGPTLSRPASIAAIEKIKDDYGGEESDLVSITHRSDLWFRDLEMETHKLLDKYRDFKTKDVTRIPVKIAVLDTGIACSPALAVPQLIKDAKARIKFGKVLKPNLSPKEDSDGHGTHCAGLLLKVCPYAEIHVYRIVRSRKKEDSIEPELVADALRHAVDIRKVDIVSMSFGWKEDNNRELREALEHAKFKKVLLFAATSNESREIAFPARADEVIAIDAADYSGEPMNFNPRETGSQQRFTAIGSELLSAWPIPLHPETGDGSGHEERRGYRRTTGTSCATPVAAATAALILEFARQPPLSFHPDIERDLKDIRGMRHVLRRVVAEEKKLSSEFTHIDITKLLCCNRLYPDGGRWDELYSQRTEAADAILKCLTEQFGLDVKANLAAAIKEYNESFDSVGDEAESFTRVAL